MASLFRIESYLKPLIWSYISKYVKNLTSQDFELFFWKGDALFSNLELNLEVLDQELHLPLTFASGHVQELRITVPWRKIASEPIILNVKSMELVLNPLDPNKEKGNKKATEKKANASDSSSVAQGSGYVNSLLNKIVCNVQMNFDQVIIKYQESDISFSINVEKATLRPADENWLDTYIQKIVYDPDFVLRKKLSISDVNICLDRCDENGVVKKYKDPMLYRCDFDVRIMQKFASPASTVPYFYRLDLFLGHLQFCVATEQIPMLVRLYHLFTWLMQTGSTVATSSGEGPNKKDVQLEAKGDEGAKTTDEPASVEVGDSVPGTDAESQNSISWTDWFFGIPKSIIDELSGTEVEEESEPSDEDQDEERSTLDSSETKIPTRMKTSPLVTESSSSGESVLHLPTKVSEGEAVSSSPIATTHFGVYIKTLTILLRVFTTTHERSAMRRKVTSVPDNKFLKCSIQGIVCDFILRGNENSHSVGVSSMLVHGLGFCPCGVQDCMSSEGGDSSQGGECYFDAGKVKQNFAASSLFREETDGEALTECCYDVNHKDFHPLSETELLEKTPAFFMKYVVIMKESTVIPATSDKPRNLLNAEITDIVYHFVAAPFKALVSSGLLHRLKTINEAINNYNYQPYNDSQVPLPDSQTQVSPSGVHMPVITYRFVSRLPLIEILAADHPSDYSPEKRAEYFKKTGGIVDVTSLPRSKPEWPKMVISCDSLVLDACDPDGHFDRLRRRMVGLYSFEDARERLKHVGAVEDESLLNARTSREQKTAEIQFEVKEALLIFNSEPVELCVGIKSVSLECNILNYRMFSPMDILQQLDGGCFLNTLTCSTRLQTNCKMLCLPFNLNIMGSLDWEPRLRSPSLNVDVKFDADVTLFVGPETLVSLSQLSEKLLVYLQEFLPSSLQETPDVAAEPYNVEHINFPHIIKHNADKSWTLIISDSMEPDNCLDVVMNHSHTYIEFQFPQKRMLRSLILDMCDKVIFQDQDKFKIEYFEEYTSSYIPYYESCIAVNDYDTMSFDNNSTYCVSSTIWRFTIETQYIQPYSGLSPIEWFASGLSLETTMTAEVCATMKLPHVTLNLVNSTHYAGKGLSNSVLQNYSNTDGVNPVEHLIAAVKCNFGELWYTSIDGVSRLCASSSVAMSVWDYELLLMDTVFNEIDLRAVVTLAANPKLGHPSLQLVTNDVTLKFGASIIHSLTYSVALWNQIINTFDVKQNKMMPLEDRPKIILHRVLVSNDLDADILLLFPETNENKSNEILRSNTCTAWSYSGRGLESVNNYSFKFPDDDDPFDVDISKDGYQALGDEDDSLFVNVVSISASQKLVKISGHLIMANGLKDALILGMYSGSPLTALKTIFVPGRGVAPTTIFAPDDYEMMRIRYADNDVEEEQMFDFASHLKSIANNEVISIAFQLPILFTESDYVCEYIWVTIIREDIDGISRYLVTISPGYCIRSWLCNKTIVHLTGDDDENEVYTAQGKGEICQMDLKGDGSGYGKPAVPRQLSFQSSAEVPPSKSTVPLKKMRNELHSCVPSIDTIVSQIIAKKVEDASRENSSSRWPFVTEDIDKDDWNTEINPETEILVSFSNWIEGLPTIVAEIRPWAIFVNLSGVELLFGQETFPVGWEEFWVPYKCVFSPKLISIPGGRFLLGLKINENIVKSEPLKFSEHEERLSVINVNKDCKVPVGCFSRLDLCGGSQVACFTIETKVEEGMLVFIIRPTYSIQNRTSMELYAEGVTFSSCVTQRRESWTDSKLSSYSVLEANREDGTTMNTAVPILHFVTDGHDYSPTVEYYKYLAVSCGGPWWFVKLVDCNNPKQDQSSIVRNEVAVTLPKVDCKILSPPLRHQLRNVSIAGEAVVVGSYSQNGQVWISVIHDNAPQVFIHNKSKLPLFCAEKDPTAAIPNLGTPWFEQFLVIPPETSCPFSFLCHYHDFPGLSRQDKALPEMLMAIVSQDLIDLVTSNEIHGLTSAIDRPRHLFASSKNNKMPSGNLLFPEFAIDWRTIQSVEKHAWQTVDFPNKSVKITAQCVAYTHHLFIEKSRCKEVSAQSVRSGFRDNQDPALHHTPDSGLAQKIALRADNDVLLCEKPSTSRAKETKVDSDDEDETGGPPTPPLMMVAKKNKHKRSWIIKIYIPELDISIQDNFVRSSDREREVFGLSFEGIYLNQFPMLEDSVMSPEECPMKETWVYSLRICNFQVDTPDVVGRQPAEFCVVIENTRQLQSVEKDLIPTSVVNIDRFFQSEPISSITNLDAVVTLTPVSDDEMNLETVWIQVLPCSVFIEDRLLSYVVPSLQRICNVFLEGYAQMEKIKVTSASNGFGTEITMECGAIPHVRITDDQSSGVVSSFYSDKELPLNKGGTKKTRSVGEGSSLFSRNVSFAPTTASSSSGLNSSRSSIASSTMSNLRLASVSPPPPSPMVPLEPHGSSLKWPFDAFQNLRQDDKKEEGTSDGFATKRVKVPKELLHMFDRLSRPLRLRAFNIQPTKIELTLHTEKLVYVALDRSVVVLKGFDAFNSVTTQFHLGLELTLHYTMGTVFTLGNPVRVVASLELLGSPGTLARSVGTGLRNLVVLPYEGFLTGPKGFVSGLGFGVSSFVKEVTSGSLLSLTNWAKSVSRNIDCLTLDQQEGLILQSATQAELQGFRDGLVQGLTGCGIRLLGAIGGLSHHTIQNVVDGYPTTSGLLGGVGRGVFGAIVRPVGGFAELISMTGQGILLATGWKPKPTAKRGNKRKAKSTDVEKGGVSYE